MENRHGYARLRTMSKRVRVMIAALIIITACVVAIATALYSVFSAERVVRTHLEAGSLNVSLFRVSHEKQVEDERGLLKTVTVPEEELNLSLRENDDRNAFDLEGGDLIDPGFIQKATFEVRNDEMEDPDGVPFRYWVEIVFTHIETGKPILPQEYSGNLADQLIVRLNGEEEGLYLSEGGLRIGSGEDSIPLNPGERSRFSLELEFKDLGYESDPLAEGDKLTSENDFAASETVRFDIVVHIIQFT